MGENMHQQPNHFQIVQALLSLALVPLLACGTTKSADSATTADAALTGADAADATNADATADVAADISTTPAPADPKAYDGECPDFSVGGTIIIQSGGFKRTLHVSVPDDQSVDSPLVFLWHGLGDNGTNFASASAFDAKGIAKDRGAFVVTPDDCSVKGLKCQQTFGWDFLTADGGADAQLFDDVLACITQSVKIDRRRVYSSGFSAGGLWTTWLLVNRSQYLASVAIFSGGIDPNMATYVAPSWHIPVIGFYGSMEGDVVIVHFHELMQNLITDLRKDSFFVVDCDHESNGHTIPAGGVDTGMEFLFNHKYGDAKSSYEIDGKLPSDFPDYCKIAP